MPEKFDAIIVLGSGISEQGELYPDGVARLEKAVSLFKQGVSNKIILSGKYSASLTFVPKRTEAEALQALAIEKGVPKNCIILESESSDTVYNILYCSKIALKKKFKQLAFVTTFYHAKRVSFLCKMILGNEVKFKVFKAFRELSKEEIASRKKHEVEFLKGLKKNFEGVSPGDAGQIERINDWYWAGFERGRKQMKEFYTPKEFKKD